jgi:hypothetical protein
VPDTSPYSRRSRLSTSGAVIRGVTHPLFEVSLSGKSLFLVARYPSESRFEFAHPRGLAQGDPHLFEQVPYIVDEIERQAAAGSPVDDPKRAEFFEPPHVESRDLGAAAAPWSKDDGLSALERHELERTFETCQFCRLAYIEQPREEVDVIRLGSNHNPPSMDSPVLPGSHRRYATV